MESLLEQFAALNNIVKAAILGAIGAGIGSLIVRVFSDRLTKVGSTIIIIVCFALVTQLPKHFFPDLMGKDPVSQAIREMKQLKMAEVIFRVNPEAEAEIRASLNKIMAESPRNEVKARAQAATTVIMAKYIEKHMFSAPDDKVFFLIRRSAAVTKHLQSVDPKLCVGYFMGNPNITEAELRRKLIVEESDIKAGLVESAVKNPSKPSRTATLDELGSVLAEAYQNKGYDIQNLTELEHILTLPPAKGCQIAREFSEVLESLGQEKAVFVYKSLLLLKE